MFQYISTSGGSERVSFSQAMLRGLAADGGLYVPKDLPRLDGAADLGSGDPVALAQRIVEPFLAGDPLAGVLAELCAGVFQIPIPVTELGDGNLVLELFHGPTAAFKDFGAGFLARCLSHSPGARRVIVATSGDTGGAVAAACDGRPGLEVVILYPKGGVSSCQEQQLTCWGDNVHALGVRGSFDDCQRLVKQALRNNPWQGVSLTTANSISIARLVPQIVHHALGSLVAFAREGRALDFVIPSGNLGNASAALWAKRMGFPIGRIVLVSNANRVLSDFMESGRFQPRASVATLANAMDIGDPSNLVRLRSQYSNHVELSRELSALCVTDDSIRAAIRQCHQRHGRILDPHTATAYAALASLDASPKLIVSTAHPAKFKEVVQPLVDQQIELPSSLAQLQARPSRAIEVEAQLDAVVAALKRGGGPSDPS